MPDVEAPFRAIFPTGVPGQKSSYTFDAGGGVLVAVAMIGDIGDASGLLVVMPSGRLLLGYAEQLRARGFPETLSMMFVLSSTSMLMEPPLEVNGPIVVASVGKSRRQSCARHGTWNWYVEARDGGQDRWRSCPNGVDRALDTAAESGIAQGCGCGDQRFGDIHLRLIVREIKP